MKVATRRWLAAATVATSASRAAALSSLPYPRAAVAITVMRTKSDGSVEYLLAQRGNPPGKGSWSLPGGKIELGERVLDAAARELHEETSLRAPHVKLYPWPVAWHDVIVEAAAAEQERDDNVSSISSTDSPPPLAFHYVLTQLVAFADESAVASSGDDASDVRWVTIAEALSGDLPLHGDDVVSVLQRADHLVAIGAMRADEAVEVVVPEV